MNEPTKILCVGDLHLGRTSSKCRTSNEDSARFAIRECWKRLVDLALELNVSLLVLTGDINDKEGNIYENIAPFEAGIKRLTAKNIDVIMIAGNHDTHSLSRMQAILADPHVHLLGENGIWERFDWPDENNPQISFLGSSYPATGVGKLPLSNIPFSTTADIVKIGLAHIDYLSASSNYLCALPSELFSVRDIACWLLGHIHAPELKIESSKILLNPGSPQALHPGEPGTHGPWLLEVDNGNILPPTQLPFSDVRYASLNLDISGLQSIEEFLSFLQQELAEKLPKPAPTETPSRHSCRIKLTGRSNILVQLSTECEKILVDQPFLENRDIFLDEINLDDLRSIYDINQLAVQHDIIGATARLLLDLENDCSERATQELLVNIADQYRLLEKTQRNLSVDTPLTLDAKTILQFECRRLLDELLRHQESTQ